MTEYIGGRALVGPRVYAARFENPYGFFFVSSSSGGAGGDGPVLPDPWQARALPDGYILAMMAQEALYAGAGWVFDGGTLNVAGRVVIGLSGDPYVFLSELSALKWCTAARDVIGGERLLVSKLTGPDRAVFFTAKRARLTARAKLLYLRAINQTDATKRAALVAEALWCEAKWSGYE